MIPFNKFIQQRKRIYCSSFEYLSTNTVCLSQTHLYFPTFYRYPFNWNTLLGYLVCLILQVPPVLAAADLFMFTLILAIGFCLILQDFVSDIVLSLQQLTDDLRRSGENSSNFEQQIELKKKLYDIMQFHSEAKQLSVEFYWIFSKTKFRLAFKTPRTYKTISLIKNGPFQVC